MTGRYVLHHEGTWFYYLAVLASHAVNGTPLADGEPMTPCGSAGWYCTGREASAVAIRHLPCDEITGYRITDPETVSARYPAELSVAEWATRREDESESEVLWRLYDAVREPREPAVTPVEGEWLRMDGEPPPDDGRSWVAKLPYELQYRTEYLHLFPGYMPDFRERMTAMVKGLPRVRYVFDLKHWPNSAPHGLEVTVEVPYDKPQSEYRAATNLDGTRSRSRKGRTVTVLAARKLEIPVPYRIDGPDRAAAAAGWDRRETEIRAAVAEASVTACSACMGTGHVITGSEQYEKRQT